MSFAYRYNIDHSLNWTHKIHPIDYVDEQATLKWHYYHFDVIFVTTASEVVRLTTYGAASDENFVKIMTLLFQCFSCDCVGGWVGEWVSEWFDWLIDWLIDWLREGGREGGTSLSTVPFLGTVDSEVHIVHISFVITAYTLESLSSLTQITHNLQAIINLNKKGIKKITTKKYRSIQSWPRGGLSSLWWCPPQETSHPTHPNCVGEIDWS